MVLQQKNVLFACITNLKFISRTTACNIISLKKSTTGSSFEFNLVQSGVVLRSFAFQLVMLISQRNDPSEENVRVFQNYYVAAFNDKEARLVSNAFSEAAVFNGSAVA